MYKMTIIYIYISAHAHLKSRTAFMRQPRAVSFFFASYIHIIYIMYKYGISVPFIPLQRGRRRDVIDMIHTNFLHTLSGRESIAGSDLHRIPSTALMYGFRKRHRERRLIKGL